MIASSPTFSIVRRSICPRGTRGGTLWRRWHRFQSSMAYTGAIPNLGLYQSTSAAAIADLDLDIQEHFELPDQYLSPSPTTIDSYPTYTPSKYSLAVSNPTIEIPTAVKNFVSSLRSQPFRQILEGFKDLHRHNFLSYLTSSDFSNILISANPKLLFPISTVARKISPGTIPKANPYGRLFKTFWSDLNFVIENMFVTGHQPTTMDYTNLMSKALWTRRRELQTAFWDRMLSSGVQPNTWTYNTRLAMVAGTHPSNNLRKFPLVHSEKHTTYWQGKPQNSATEAMALYADMLKRGLYPNSMTVELLILAHARIGDINGILKIVQNVYGIVINGDNSRAQPVIAEGSPVYPTPRTLKALAVAFCRNSQFGAALQAIEHVSRIYGTAINEKTWDILLTYSYAFARPKYNLVPPDTTSKLAEIMKERTAKVEPSLQARDIIIRSLTRSVEREDLEAAEVEIRKAVSYFRSNVQHKYNYSRERWVAAPPEKSEVWRREKEMNERLYDVCMWKDAMGYWLYALLRAHWEMMKRIDSPMVEFESLQMNVLEEFGAYWHQYRPVFERPKEAGEKVTVGERVSFRTKYPASLVGLKGFPPM
ncbi:hypothetical protein TWF694_002403 [Orbilia ellipsospora]|uniref:ATPase expression protein 2, mitochondrial n=1 Tax=Orbilia ellipsospora TaxID=2528407 RepID=A0AAV9X289_9PEZI